MEGDLRDKNALGLLMLLLRNAKTLFEQTLELGGAELRQIQRTMVIAGVLVGLGLGVLALGAMAFITAAILLLAKVIPLWAAALVVALALGGFGMVCCLAGYFELRVRGLIPHRTIAVMKENAKWLKNRL